ncbi:MAG: hypothetical protein H6708_11885 [Kofleriaceae bacterium]|nr:hypothetical protein [Kofleriaceae bacterium]
MAVAAAAAGLLRCQGGGGGRRHDAPAPADATPAAVTGDGDGGDGAAADPGDSDPSLPTESGEPPDSVDPDQAVADLGAIPAWRAVVDRDQYLARRGDVGVVFGRVGGPVPPPPLPRGADGDAGVPPPTGLTWLVDETEGNGALAIKVRLDDPAPAPGTRLAVRGAWELDEARHWFWRAAATTVLPDDPDARPAKDPPAAPGLVVVKLAPPGKTVAPPQAKDGDLLEFTVVRTPARVGDGWGVSDRRWGTLMGYLVLPGERGSYGGHDLRGADEGWALRKGGTYWVRLGRVRRKGDDPPVFSAAGPPAAFP